MNFQQPTCRWLQATKRTFLLPPGGRSPIQPKFTLEVDRAPIKFHLFLLIIKSNTMTSTGPKAVDLLALDALLKAYPEGNSTLRMIRRFNRKNVLNTEEILPPNIMEIAEKLESRLCSHPAKEEEGREAGETGGWVCGERKLFACILPYFCQRYHLDMQNLEISDVLPLTQIFTTKDQITLLFEVKHICSLNSSLKTPWTPEDLLRLTSIVSQPKYLQLAEANMKWKQVSFQLFCLNGFSIFHTPRECRERWINHLDPSVSKSSWKASQDLEMFLLLKKLGCKWALVSRTMKGRRTENMIKNRAFSLAKKYCPRRTAKLKDTQVEAVITALQARLAEENASKVDMDGLMDHCQKENASSDSQGQADVPMDLFDVFTGENRYVISLDNGEENWEYDQPREIELPELFTFPTPQNQPKDSCTIGHLF